MIAMTHDAFEEAVGRIPYQYRHPRILYGLVRWLEPQTVVEVGTHIGYAASWMARALIENGRGRLYCIDNFCWTEERQEEQLEANLAACGVRQVVALLRGRSQKVEWPPRVDLAYIDGNHTYPVCRHDTLKARELGASVIVLHDTVSWEGSRRMSEEVRQSWHDWDMIEDVTEEGLLIAKLRAAKGPCKGADIGERWDKPLCS